MRACTLAFLLFVGCSGGQETPQGGVQAGCPTGLAERICVRVVDGDTIELDGGEKVRYIGIDTPETVHPHKPVQRSGKEADEANRALVGGRRVRLEYDTQRMDKYGRTLAYVWAGDVMVNERLVQMGYARVSTYPPNVKHQKRFLEAQREAREAGRGIDATPPVAKQRSNSIGRGATTVYITRAGRRFHRPGCRHLRLSQTLSTKQDAIARGLTPCSACKP